VGPPDTAPGSIASVRDARNGSAPGRRSRFLEYKAGLHGEPDESEAKLLLAKTVERFQGLFNFIVGRPVGAPQGEDDASYGYAASATWQTFGAVRLGVQAFGVMGDDHGLRA
jgi:hypothetical protein